MKSETRKLVPSSIEAVGPGGDFECSEDMMSLESCYDKLGSLFSVI